MHLDASERQIDTEIETDRQTVVYSSEFTMSMSVHLFAWWLYVMSCMNVTTLHCTHTGSLICI